MKTNNNMEIHFDIINNVITNENIKTKCIDAIKNYNANQTNTDSKVELVRFARHISIENYFLESNSNNIEDQKNNTVSNIEKILEELSFSSKNYSKENETVLLLQLSSILDNFLNELSPTDKKIYLYRYFFAYCVEDIASHCNTQSHNIQKTLSQCNNKLNHLLSKNNLIADCKSLLLSFTDIDDTHLLSLINTVAYNTKSTSTVGTENTKSKFTLKFCLNIVIGVTLTFLIILNIYQYISSIDKTSALSSKKNNSQEINIDDFFIYKEDQKIVNMKKLLEYSTYASDEYPPLDFTVGNYTANYDAYIFPESFPLSELIGDEIPELSKNYAKYYKLIGTDNYQYIIYKSQDDCAI